MKTKKIQVYLDDEKEKFVRDQAKKFGMSMSQFINMMIVWGSTKLNGAE